MKAYSIVEFIEESAVEIIPSSWLLPDNKTALWPKGIIPSVLKRYLKSRIEPSDDWSNVKIRILGQADTLVDAGKKAQKAENTSHLSSDSNSQEDPSCKQRFKKKPYRFCNSSSSDEENIQTEPLSPPEKRHRKTKTIYSKNCATRPILKTFPDIQGKTYIYTFIYFTYCLNIVYFLFFNSCVKQGILYVMLEGFLRCLKGFCIFCHYRFNSIIK
ncbi:hypothetical protein PUN28_002160 [Cardiocondyla obscurior]|uniref:Uncharacterized protein n=1 Tax=Cardiocondyla obscurior TaxID=286306 RepID=A0AAW2GSU9_9HYME